MANIWKRLLSAGSQTAPRIADDIVESKALQKKLIEEASEEAPEILGKGTSKAAKAAQDVPDAAWREIIPEPKKVTDLDAIIKMAKENPKTAATIAALTGGTLANQFMGGDEQQIPFRPESQMEPKSEIAPIEQKEEKKTVRAEAPTEDGLDFDALAKKLDQGMAGLPQEAAPEIDEIAAAQARASDNAVMAMLGKAASQIGSGIAGIGAGQQVKVDTSGFDDLMKLADRPVKDLSERQKYQKAKAQLTDEKAMRDPKSEISKQMSQIAQELGFLKPGQTASAAMLKEMGFNPTQLISVKEAAAARKEAAALAKESKIKEKEEALSEKQRKFVQGLRKEATTGTLGKQYSTYATAQRMGGALEEFTKDPSGYSDYATLMGGLKALQGDESVVREAEVRLGMSATSAINSALNQLQRAATGKSLQPEQRQQMIQTIKTLTDSAKQQYMYSVQPILEQAQMEGIDPNLILSGSLSGAKKEEKSTQTTETREFKQQLTPGSIVTTKSGSKYRIGADGKTGTLVK